MADAETFLHRRGKLTVVSPRRRLPVLVCGKCLARHHKGRKLKDALRSELKHRGVSAPIGRARLIETGCFDICPKGAIVLASGRSLRQGAYVLLADRKTVSQALDLLLGGFVQRRAAAR
jgi:hypothetical protein